MPCCSCFASVRDVDQDDVDGNGAVITDKAEVRAILMEWERRTSSSHQSLFGTSQRSGGCDAVGGNMPSHAELQALANIIVGDVTTCKKKRCIKSTKKSVKGKLR